MANTTVRQKSKQHVTGRTNNHGIAQTNTKSSATRGLRPTTWTGDDIKTILGSLLKSTSLEKHLDAPLKSLCTDSRKCRKGDIFIALQGPNQHGLGFLSEALKSGIGAVVSDAPLPAGTTCGVPFYLVVDGQLALRKLASEWRARFDIPIVAVAGSVGKTTTKDLIAAALSGKFDNVLRTEGSQNGFFGIPATLSRLNLKSEAAVIEVGIDDIGAMVQHFEVVKPGIAIVTAIAPEHLERLKDIETIAEEETLLLKRTVASGGIAIVNLDDEHCRISAAALKAEQKVGYSLNPKIKLKTDMLVGRQSPDGLSIEINGQIRDISFSKEKFQLPLLGRHNAGNLLGAIATAAVVGLTPDEIRNGLKAFQPEEGRSRIEQLTNGTVVICDYYNSSPASVSAALDLLKDRSIVTGARGKKYACLGDMLELGREEESMHRRIADKLAATGVDKVLLYGERMKWLADELRRRKFESDVAHFESHASLAEHLLERLRPDDHVLIKGSRGMAMEQVWHSLKPRT